MMAKARAALRGAKLYVVLTIAAGALFYLAANLSRIGPLTLFAAAVVFACLVILFIAAQAPPEPHPARPNAATTLLAPSVVVSEVRAAALVTYSQIGTVTVKKERGCAPPNSLIKPLHDKLLGEALVVDVGVRVVAGVNLKHLREEDVRVSGGGVEITLPPTKVLMVYVDESLTRAVSHKAGWLTGRDITLMDAARRDAMEALVGAAIEKGLLEKAGQQAAAAVAALARGLGFEQVNVCPTLPPPGAYFEELQDPAMIARLKAEPAPLLPRDDQAGDA
ncbi:MAG: hypothetical protein CUN48_08840 [Candidatus Thermofonsia Clade 3 bacterium]|jgi:hypothetical protein|uniref:DUF4230 domain-containing protein n=1 Tax=Candidatus Thermofonsia Clade 3 bacterium TaxID=2364212 RepID=A0A2M8QC71_9CHLR|nr:DUF4230 domain-containing protein [Candidatus Roseilinea sp. NK_OTU-006]PJF47389.1 MAG: hypothetical protein CUN48_08840 [Candidatus Thermofonsia Clade 3 bacterium]